MSDKQNNPINECKCGNAKQTAELQKKLRELHKYVAVTIPKLEHEIQILRKAARR